MKQPFSLRFKVYTRKGETLQSAKAKTAYLDANRNRLQKPVGDLPVLALFSTKSTLKRQEGKGPERTIGVYETKVQPIYKGAILARTAY